MKKPVSPVSVLGIILIVTTVTAGDLLFYWFYPDPLDFRIVSLVTAVNGLFIAALLATGYHFSIGYIRKRLKQAELNKVLYDLTQKTAQHSKMEDLYKDLLEAAVKAIAPAEKGSIMLLDPTTSKLHFVAAEGYDWDILKRTYLDLEDSYLYRESKGNIVKSVVIDDPFGYDRKHLKTENIKQILAANSDNVLSTISTPIIIDGQLHGMINVDSPERHVYTESDVNLIEVFAYEITHVIRLYDSLEMNNYLSTHDALTGIYNRHYVNQEILPLLASAEHVALISMDINHLKGTNDTLGHSIGDRLLVQFTRGIQAFMPEGSYFARYGGDEFLLFIEDRTITQVQMLMDEALIWFEEHPLTIGEFQLHVSFSYGVAIYPEESEDFDKILHLADQRMYKHKRLQQGE